MKEHTVDPFDDPWRLVARRLAASADRIAVRAGAREHRYGELEHASSVLSDRLRGHTRATAPVALLLGILPEYLAADLALLQSNLVKVPLNPMLSAVEMAYILEHSNTQVLLTSSRLGELDAAKVRELATLVQSLTVLDVDLDDLLATDTAESGWRAPASPEDRAAIYYTGGTTGRPKGVVHTRRGVAATIVAHALEAEIGSADILLLSTSLSHSAGAFAAAALARGAQLELLDRFDAARFCDIARRSGATWAMVVPTMLYRLLDHLADNPADAPALRTLVYGSAPITPSRLQEAIERFGPVLIQLFGQTECPNWGTALTKRDHAAALDDPTLLSSCGSACMLADVRLVDSGEASADGTVHGEILLTAPYAMAEYLDDVDATARTLVDGWIHTRDIGVMDRRGYVTVKDRTSDMIITGGYNVYSSEVEAELQRIEGVAQVAVIGVPDPDWGEAVCAVIVARPGASLTESSVIDAARDLLGSYKRPKRVTFRDELPLTPFGKADKKLLRAPFWATQERMV